MEFLTTLWTEKHEDIESKFDIKEHETLKDAVIYLIKNGANYENQEIVKKVDWMPNGSNPLPGQESPKPEVVGPPPVVGGPVAQPEMTDYTRTTPPEINGGKKSIFDGIIPANLMPMLQSDD